MEQTVYIDVFFLINFSMDFLGLFLASKLLGRRESLLRLFIAAIFGGFYACFALIFSLDSISTLFSFLIDALACLVIAFIASFHKSAWSGFISFACVFGATSILLGGAMTALFYAFNRLGLDRAFGDAENQSGDGISVWIFAIFASISALIAIFSGKLFKKKALRKSGFVEIEYCKRKVRLPCICDSGNLLREPISQLPCILIELEAAESIFSKEFRSCFKHFEFENVATSAFFEASRIRMIPAQTASGDTLLVGFRPDFIRIDMGRGATAVDAYIAFSKEKIAVNGVKALIPSELAFGVA